MVRVRSSVDLPTDVSLSSPTVRFLPNPSRPWILATLSGLLYSIGFVDFDRWYLAWPSLVPVLFALQGAKTWKRALLLSWWFGFVAHLVGYHWVIHLLKEFAYLPTPLAVIGYVLLAVGQAASFAAFGLLAWALSRRASVPLGAAIAPAIMAMEWAFPLLFPSYMANSQARMPWVTQIADLGGPILVSGLLGVVNGALFDLVASRLEKRRVRAWLVGGAAAALALSVGYSVVRVRQMDERDAAASKLKVAIVQANVGARDKHEEVDAGIKRFRRMTDEAMALPGIGLVVWPESGFNRSVTPRTTNLTGQVAREVTAPMILGALRVEAAGKGRKVWNSAIALEPGGRIAASYDKTVLLAFGEYVPGDKFFPKIYDLLPYSSHFERGASTAALPVGPYRLSTDICYEDILPSFIRTLMGPIDADGTRPHAMVNVTNDSWYGPVEPHIHLALASFRAIEHRRWLVRSTATGISAFVDAAGRVRQQSGFETEQLLVEDVPMIEGGATVYGVLGDWPGWVSFVASALALGIPALRRRREAQAARVDRAA